MRRAAALVAAFLGLLAVSPGLAQTPPGKLAGTWRPHQCSDCVWSLAVTTDSVWVGTLSGGVVHIDRASGDVRRHTTADGLGGNAVARIAVGPAGDVWVATRRTTIISPLTGISHWDGRSWTVYGTADGLPQAEIGGLAAGPNGTALAIVPGGLARFDGARWRVDTPAEGLPSAKVTGVCITAAGTPWAATDLGLARHDNTTWAAVPLDGLGADRFAAVAEGDDGTMWALAGSAGGPDGTILGHFDPRGWPAGGHWRTYAVPGNGGDALFFGGPGGGRIVTAVDDDLAAPPAADRHPLVHQLVGGTWSTVDVLAETGPQVATQTVVDPAGAVWIATLQSGVAVRDGGAWTWLRTELGIPSPVGMAVSVDRRDRPWAGAVLMRPPGDTGVYLGEYDGKRWLRHGIHDVPGLEPQALGIWPDGIDADALGNVWLVLRGAGVARHDGMAWATWSITDVVGGISHASAIAADGRGGAWVAGLGAAHLEGGTWRRYTTADGLASNAVNSIATDPRPGQEIVWLATDAGISRFDGTAWRTLTVTDGVPAAPIYVAMVSVRDGAAWFGTRDLTRPNGAGIVRFDGTSWVAYGAADGIVGQAVWALAEAPDGAIWAVTGADNGPSGVLRFDGTRWAHYGVADGLADDIAFGIDVASDGTVWVATLAGVSEFRPAGAAHPPTPATETPDTPTATPTTTPTAAGTATSTPTLSATPTVTATPPAGAGTPTGGPCVCAIVRGRVPDVVIADAVANPVRVYGWGLLRDPRRPEGPFNPRRTCLTLERPAVPYHVLFNGLEWRAGCP